MLIFTLLVCSKVSLSLLPGATAARPPAARVDPRRERAGRRVPPGPPQPRVHNPKSNSQTPKYYARHPKRVLKTSIRQSESLTRDPKPETCEPWRGSGMRVQGVGSGGADQLLPEWIHAEKEQAAAYLQGRPNLGYTTSTRQSHFPRYPIYVFFSVMNHQPGLKTRST